MLPTRGEGNEQEQEAALSALPLLPSHSDCRMPLADNPVCRFVRGQDQQRHLAFRCIFAVSMSILDDVRTSRAWCSSIPAALISKEHEKCHQK